MKGLSKGRYDETFAGEDGTILTSEMYGLSIGQGLTFINIYLYFHSIHT